MSLLESDELQSLNAIGESSNKFSLNLYKELRKESGNVIVSPLSVHLVLTLAYHGAVGQTAEEMENILQLPVNKKQILEGHKALLLCLENPVLKLATKMFTANDLKILPDYQALATNYYLSDVEEKNFSTETEKSRQNINSWVESKTNNKISNLLAPGVVDSLTRLVLVSAVHFKANWSIQFNKNSTYEAPFYVTPTNPVNVDMMSLRNKKLRYANSNNLKADIVELPYEGKEFSMILIVPKDYDGLSYVEDQLEVVDLNSELSKLRETEVNLLLPKFKIEKTMDLNNTLKVMGIKTAFSATANFSKISDEGLAISKVVQKAFVEVNEEGTEAAAATGITIVRLSCSRPVRVVCNKPFIFVITRKSSNFILFISRVSNISS